MKLKLNKEAVAAAKAKLALAVVKEEPKALALIKEQELTAGLQSLGAAVASITKESVAPVWKVIKDMENLTENYVELAKKSVERYVLENGKVVTDAGTRRWSSHGLVLEIQPQGSGYDNKSLEALLRAKSIDPAHGMDSTVQLKANEGKLADLVKRKKVTQAELDTCRKSGGWKVMGPKKEE